MGAVIAIAALAASVGFAVFAHVRTGTPSTPPPNPGGGGSTFTPPDPSQQKTPPVGQVGSSKGPPPSKNSGGTGALQLVQKVGELEGEVIGNSAQTREGKSIAPGVGGASALTAYLLLIGGTAATLSLAAFAGAIVIAFDVTVAVVTVFDQIEKAIKTNEWKDFCRAVRALTTAGKFGAGYAYFKSKVKDFDEIEKVWPDRSEDWYGGEDPQQLGRPWPGFPGPPVCSAAVALAYPGDCLNPAETNGINWTFQGAVIDPVALLAASQADVDAAREAALASDAPAVGISFPSGAFVTSTTGIRDVRKVEPYATALRRDSELRYGINVPWVASPPFVKDQRTPLEKAVDAANLVAKTKIAEQQRQQQVVNFANRNHVTIADAQNQLADAHGPPPSGQSSTANANNTSNTGSTQAGADVNNTVAQHTGGQSGKGRANGADY
jgi:hypothetical protein